MKDSDGMGIRILIVVTCHRLLNRTEIVKKFMDDFNNSIYLSMKASKKSCKSCTSVCSKFNRILKS